MASAAAAPRYAPEDPTLPKPWKGLVDGKTGYLYFWNPDTNVTQYERPVASSHTGSAPHKSSAAHISSSVQVQQSSQGQRRKSGYNDDDDRYSRGSNGGLKPASGTRSYQVFLLLLEIMCPLRLQHLKLPVFLQRFLERCDICSWEELNVVRCAALFWGACKYWSALIRWTNFEKGFPNHPSSWRRLPLVHHAGFSAPTPIQAQSWPIALQGRDIVAIAKTGSGKTLGYLIPGFMHLKRRHNNPQLGPTVLVLSPTRELATQIQEEAVKFGKSSKLSCTCLYGGAPKVHQLRDLDRGTDIVVATPGRLNDIIEMKRVSLHQVSYLVLDEADRMLDMGFEPQIRKIVKEVPTRRQTLMYTATWPKEVRKIAADLLVNPVQVNIGNVDELVANKAITQYVEILSPMEKHRRLEQILRSQEPGSKIIIFCSTKKMCDQLSRSLIRQFGAAAIHGDKSQGERDYVLNQFRTGRCPVLVATDVAARGLDIKDIRVVINYDFPTGVEDYVHRIGRTGRAGATGVAYTFFGDQDAKHASDLIKVLEGANQRVPVELRDKASRGGGMGRARRQWGSSSGGRDAGRGGRNDSNYSGRDGGRGSWGIPERGGGRGPDRESRDSDRYGRSFNGNVDGPGTYHHRSFHERIVRVGDGARDPSRSRSRSRSRSPNKGSGLGDCRIRTARSRSRSPDKYGRAPPARERSPVRSFHKRVAEHAQSPPPSQHKRVSPYNSDNARGFKNSVDPKSHPGERSRSPSDGRGKENLRGSYVDAPRERGIANGPRLSYLGEGEEEEEEGMIHPDEDCMPKAADENPRTSSP
ncbi:hypothetical protein HYC85_005915 [Camellia sinensis]|uniref:RNA helicase n=1 Tax=Camellia sinensis TaxID=4442 RepID=A0A7J7I0U5_CAMSI|nr:hypothetical protein HYC85_005915 [Camellia sinensis]